MSEYFHGFRGFFTIRRSDSLGGRIIQSTLGSAGLRIGAALLGLANSILLARLLGVDQFGIYSYVLALINTLAIPVYLGVPALVVREVAVYQGSGEWGKVRGLVRRTHQMVLISSVIIALGCYAYIHFRQSANGSVIDEATLIAGLVLLPVMAFSELRGAILRGLHYVSTGMLPDQIVRPGVMVIFLCVISVGTIALTPPLAMTLNVAASIFALVVGALLLRARMPSQLKIVPPIFESRQWAKSLLPFTLLAGMSGIISQVDILLLGWFAQPGDIGAYRAAAQLAMQVSFGIITANFVLAPYAARLYAQGDMRRMERMFVLSAQATTLLALPVILVLVFAGDTVLGFIFGKSFDKAGQALAILSLSQFLLTALGSTGLALTMTGHEKSVLVITLFGVISTVILGLLLIPPFGINGAAFAMGGAAVAQKLLSLWYVHARLNIRVSVLNLFNLRRP